MNLKSSDKDWDLDSLESCKLDFTKFFPTVLQVFPTDDYKIYVYFNDGSVRLFDVMPLLKNGTVFEPLRNLDVFKNTITIINGTVAWDLNGDRDEYRCIDLDPLVLFNSPKVKDPLESDE